VRAHRLHLFGANSHVMAKTIIVIALTTFILGAVGGGWGVSLFHGRMTDNLISGSLAAEASTTVGTLTRLRDGNTAEAIELLEIKLDGALIGLGAFLPEIPESRRDPLHIKAVEMAHAYRTRFPRANDSPEIADGVARAFSLLDGQ
jgi:hypothetical protein